MLATLFYLRRTRWEKLWKMADKINQGFTLDTQGTELKLTAVPVPQYRHEEKTQERTGSNNNLLKLAVVLIVILIIAVVVIGVFYAKEVRDDDDDNETNPLKATTRPTLRTTSAPTLPTCLDESCVRSAAGKMTAAKLTPLHNFIANVSTMPVLVICNLIYLI